MADSGTNKSYPAGRPSGGNPTKRGPESSQPASTGTPGFYDSIPATAGPENDNNYHKQKEREEDLSQQRKNGIERNR